MARAGAGRRSPCPGRKRHAISRAPAREGAKLTFKWAGAGVTTGTVDGKTLTMDDEGVVLSYKR